jgi:hypothetical protein
LWYFINCTIQVRFAAQVGTQINLRSITQLAFPLQLHLSDQLEWNSQVEQQFQHGQKLCFNSIVMAHQDEAVQQVEIYPELGLPEQLEISLKFASQAKLTFKTNLSHEINKQSKRT